MGRAGLREPTQELGSGAESGPGAGQVLGRGGDEEAFRPGRGAETRLGQQAPHGQQEGLPGRHRHPGNGAVIADHGQAGWERRMP